MKYKDAGVNINTGNELVEQIKPIATQTKTDGVINGIGGFGSMFKLPPDYKNPILVSSTDGVGTKLLLATEQDDLFTIGIDLVAMCANDVIVQGAKPLFFLDYIASGKLDIEHTIQIIKGIGRGCKMADMALIGGESAEMPGLYSTGQFDLAGFCVGIVEEDQIIDNTKIEHGNVLLGIASNGPHANGYSLIRKIIADKSISFDLNIDGNPLLPTLLEPTRIYVTSLLSLFELIDVHGLSHITGGGITHNIPRMLPDGLSAEIDLSSWKQHQIFDMIQQHGDVTEENMLSTFNCGIGMVICINSKDEKSATERLTMMGETVYNIGTVVSNPLGQKQQVIYK